MSLREKAKTLQEWMDEVTYVRQGKTLIPENSEQVKQKLVRLEDAQQEIERREHERDLAIKELRRLMEK